MRIDGCCKNVEKAVISGFIVEGGFRFPYLLTYCKNCGRVGHSRTSINDGEKRETFDRTTHR